MRPLQPIIAEPRSDLKHKESSCFVIGDHRFHPYGIILTSGYTDDFLLTNQVLSNVQLRWAGQCGEY